MNASGEALSVSAIQNHEDVQRNVRVMLDRCPVAHGTDRLGRFSVIARYQDVFEVLRDWETYESGSDVRVPAVPPGIPAPEMPPLTANPPAQRQFRKLMNPYLTPDAIARHEPGVRAVAAELIDEFLMSGSTDFVGMVTRPYSPILTFRFLLGVDESELEQARSFVHTCLYETHMKDTSEAEKEWHEWNKRIISQRRLGPRTDDLLDRLIFGTFDDGRVLTETELIGCLNILLRGGFNTTTDAASNFALRLATGADLQRLLMSNPTLLPEAIEECLRLDPPVSALARRCTKETTIAGETLSAGERLLYMIVSANRDPEEFEGPDQFRLGRQSNRHLSFGGGVHRCVGSHFARQSLRVLFEELFKRVTRIELDSGSQIERISMEGMFDVPWHIPLVCTPR
jgi:cytochrome P450